jgi:signal transduction histidine kinase
MVETDSLRQPPNREPLWLALDGLLVVSLGYLTVSSLNASSYLEDYDAVESFGWVLMLAPTALVLVRRLAPVTALVLAVVSYLLAGFDHGEDNNWILAAPFLAYTVTVARGPERGAWLVVASAAAVTAVGFYGPGQTAPVVILIIPLMFAIGWAVGLVAGRTHHRTVRLAEDARQARERLDATARQAVADERARIAIELHDAVGHAVNVMVMQAGAARLATSDEGTRSMLFEIERVGRSALTDLDRMLGLLHDRPEHGTSNAPVAPAHGINDIATLVAGVRSGGAEVVLHDRCTGNIDTVADRPVSAAAYRIVQESLTNAIKHAGPATIVIDLDCTSDALRLTITDDGRGSAATPSSGGGRGLAGMRERVSVLGGSMSAAPRAGGGYVVHAEIPRVRPT